ncbi:MAG TPA: large conductance mechanosensitive channel protein MscL [Candidatus Binataceae bacterium]|nr:large conductance mechanosensitive channel protein MscL [Candidatus Binataceae bacterium]
MVKGFTQFLLRGNVVDLAVAVVVGVAFNSVVQAFVKDLITPLIAAIGGQPNFSALAFELNHSRFMIGDLINAIVSFVIISAVVYFLVVLPINALIAMSSETPPDPTTKRCPECASEIPIQARRCAFCTQPLAS